MCLKNCFMKYMPHAGPTLFPNGGIQFYHECSVFSFLPWPLRQIFIYTFTSHDTMHFVYHFINSNEKNLVQG